jgi:ribosome-binding factor A
MSKHREERVTERIKNLIAEFVSKESNRQSLITITNVSISHKFDKAIVLVTVLPESSEETVLNFLKRQGTEIRNYVRENINIHTIPFFSFAIDKGEKNRQKIDEISKNI